MHDRAELARKFGRTLVLVQVVEPVVSAVTSAEAAELVGLEDDTAERKAREYLTSTPQTRAAKKGLRVEAIVRRGDAADNMPQIIYCT